VILSDEFLITTPTECRSLLIQCVLVLKKWCFWTGINDAKSQYLYDLIQACKYVPPARTHKVVQTLTFIVQKCHFLGTTMDCYTIIQTIRHFCSFTLFLFQLYFYHIFITICIHVYKYVHVFKLLNIFFPSPYSMLCHFFDIVFIAICNIWMKKYMYKYVYVRIRICI
jgi:hypothetical protein